MGKKEKTVKEVKQEKRTEIVDDMLKYYDPYIVELVKRSVDKNMPALLIGHTGVGKTTLIRELAKKDGKSLYRIQLTGQTGTDDIVGRWGAKDGSTYWIDGLLTRAMREGHWVVLDELNMALPEILAKLHSLLDDDRWLIITEKDGEKVLPHEDFRLFATMNPSVDYAGTKEMNMAFTSRFPIIARLEKSPHEAEIIEKQSGCSQEDATVLAAVVDEIRMSKLNNTISFFASTRDAIYAGQLIKSGVPLEKAVYASIVDKAPEGELVALSKIIEVVLGVTGIRDDKQQKSLVEILKDYEKIKKEKEEAENSLKERLRLADDNAAEWEKLVKERDAQLQQQRDAHRAALEAKEKEFYGFRDGLRKTLGLEGKE